MRTTSVFCAECLCGRHFESERREYTCPNCKRVIVLAWGIEPSTDEEREREPEHREAAA
jgi:DNA-directed RNA polymerase subunit RPC12/RpoP